MLCGNITEKNAEKNKIITCSLTHSCCLVCLSCSDCVVFNTCRSGMVDSSCSHMYLPWIYILKTFIVSFNMH